MYKTSVPIAIQSMSDNHFEKDLQKYLEYFRRGKVERVFLVILPGTYTKKIDDDIKSEKLKRAVEFFKENDLEVGIWISGFGHGAALKHDSSVEKRNEYQKLTGVYGESYEHGYCPLDKQFQADYMEIVRQIALLEPNLIMVDDDFRLNNRMYYMGCFCPLHLEEFYRMIGEELPREKIEEYIFTGGQNKYRDAYLELSRKTLVDFAKLIRRTIDEINPDIRGGICVTPSGWDLEGDRIELAKVFAGKNKPFMRPFGPPYSNQYNFIEEIEVERLQMKWIKDEDEEIEAFVEGDVYPRPRYNVASKALELMDLVMCCDGRSDGILKYMFNYDLKVGYETGYMEKHIKNIEIKQCVHDLFVDKQIIGVSVFGAMHKMRDFVFPEKLEAGIVKKLEELCRSHTANLISKNGVPTCYESGKYPVVVCGENARHISLDLLSQGAVLDATAAAILQERGVDTGLVKTEVLNEAFEEYYMDVDDTIVDISGVRLRKIVCSDKAQVLSVLLPDKTPGAYTYENHAGIRFLVFAGDFQFSSDNANYFNNYYRQRQVIDGIEWVGRKRLPAVCAKNPNLYIMTAKNENAMSVLLVNIFMDEMDAPVVTLDAQYSKIRFINCNGVLDKDKVFLDEVAAFGFAAFEVER